MLLGYEARRGEQYVVNEACAADACGEGEKGVALIEFFERCERVGVRNVDVFERKTRLSREFGAREFDEFARVAFACAVCFFRRLQATVERRGGGALALVKVRVAG